MDLNLMARHILVSDNKYVVLSSSDSVISSRIWPDMLFYLQVRKWLGDPVTQDGQIGEWQGQHSRVHTLAATFPDPQSNKIRAFSSTKVNVPALGILSILLNLKSQICFLTESPGYILDLRWLCIMSPYNYLSNKNSVYSAAPPCKTNEGKQENWMCLACMCGRIPTKGKWAQWLAVSRNGYWAEQMTGLGVWLFTIYLFIAPLLGKTLFFSVSSLSALQFQLMSMWPFSWTDQ